jgi:hypothetical protein
MYGLREVLERHSIVGWHCTRLTEPEIAEIVTNGMRLPNAEMLVHRIDEVQKAGLVSADGASKWRAKNQAHETNRAGMIWFCFFPPHIAGQSGIERFFRSWGGEALYNSHEDYDTGEALRSIGIPCIVEAEVPIASLPVHGGLMFKIARRYLVSRGYKTREPLEHEDRAKSPLLASHIRRIIRFPDPEFIEMTRCDSWRPALTVVGVSLPARKDDSVRAAFPKKA